MGRSIHGKTWGRVSHTCQHCQFEASGIQTVHLWQFYLATLGMTFLWGAISLPQFQLSMYLLKRWVDSGVVLYLSWAAKPLIHSKTMIWGRNRGIGRFFFLSLKRSFNKNESNWHQPQQVGNAALKLDSHIPSTHSSPRCWDISNIFSSYLHCDLGPVWDTRIE